MLGGGMNTVMRFQAERLNHFLIEHRDLEFMEFMSDMALPFDQQDRMLAAISRLKRPTAGKIGRIIELSGRNPINDMLLRWRNKGLMKLLHFVSQFSRFFKL